MSLRVVSMAELRLEVLLEPGRTGDSVAAVCRRRGISRQTFYEYRRRFEAEGAAGLEPRSRCPIRSPRQIEAAMELAICRLRKEHPRWGARRIAAELRRGGLDPPAISTIHRVLRRNNLVADHPERRPKANQRFERDVPNDLWQIDATGLRLASEAEVWAMTLLDDHARFLLAARVALKPTGEAAWACFEEASVRHGMPRQLLSDNGLCFTGRRAGFEVAFERRVRSLGVAVIHSRPRHPETLGKLERFHRTMKEWLADQPRADDLAGLQQTLDRFRSHYNEERPHQALGDLTPAERYRPAPDLGLVPADLPQPDYPRGAIVRTVWNNGVVTFNYHTIGVGRRWAGAKVRIVPGGELVHIYYGRILLRSLAFDPNRRYQPTGSGTPRQKGGSLAPVR
jgi:transposase InsO family protein